MKQEKMMNDTSREYIERMCACAPFADQEAGIPEMVTALRALVAERDALRAEVARLERWQEAAFEAHPNLDVDIEKNAPAT